MLLSVLWITNRSQKFAEVLFSFFVKKKTFTFLWKCTFMVNLLCGIDTVCKNVPYFTINFLLFRNTTKSKVLAVSHLNLLCWLETAWWSSPTIHLRDITHDLPVIHHQQFTWGASSTVNLGDITINSPGRTTPPKPEGHHRQLTCGHHHQFTWGTSPRFHLGALSTIHWWSTWGIPIKILMGRHHRWFTRGTSLTVKQPKFTYTSTTYVVWDLLNYK